MNKLRLPAGIALAMAAVVAEGADLPAKQELAAAIARVNEYQKAHPVMKPDDRNWERATWYTGVVAAWKATRDERYLKQAMEWGAQHKWMTGTEPNGANRLFCSQTWIEVYFEKKDKSMIQPTIDWLAAPDPYSPAGQKRWYLEAKTRSYVDSLYGASAFAMLAKATGRREYLEQMQAFFDDVSGELWDEESGLYYRDNRYIGQRSANGKKVFWSRGNGWVFAGIARILEYLPKRDPRRENYEKIFRRMAGELLKRQPPDGLWRASLDDAAAEPNPETSGTGFFCYGMAWGVNHGLLQRERYLPAIGEAMGGLMRSVGADGRVEWGQQVDHRPNPAARESTHEYVTGTFLLAASEVYKMKR
jgi:rhamnogalacturonyl hydrolase YesR